ncbi:DegT/DnrJ/EryC1/StrS aminotransferase family protein [Pedobacter sp. Hv1]|uniref:DegT/DnrJ/EryC1/StrS family aminotransferase n=1 Tax=Pedobacter sp. Hv1 TaxID=1740090 RepID=UPI0006D8A7A4|nr:DegT/DnrJ/EryC1/StrS family aminotransferase [Pedobacter sp. Hv1]KQC02422.1 aminotransferase DegT [Pedobacter sp. Hv1]
MTPQPIPVNTPLLDGNELKYLTECIQTGWISSEGPFINAFETKFSSYIGCNYGIAVSNGSAALDIAIKALNIGAGDEVIMPAFTIISPAQSVVTAGATPVLVDSDPQTWNMDIDQLEAKITPRTKAIVVVHIYGLPVDMDPVLALAKNYNLKVIEDAAEMHGQTYKGKMCGSLGDISIFSFYPNKHITTGEGGMLLTNDQELAERCKKLRNLCFEPNGPRFIHYELGWNYRMTNLQAALGLAQLERIEEFIKIKRKMGTLYQEKLAFLTDKGYQLPLADVGYAQNIYWIFGLVAPDQHTKEEMVKYLAVQQIGTRPFFWAMHEQPVFKNMGFFKDEQYPVAEKLARNGFYIPSGLGLKEEEILTVTHLIKDFVY